MTIKLGWFSTGRGEGSKRLLTTVQENIKAGKLDAKIDFVFCSRERGETEATDRFLQMVEDYQIPLVSYSYRRFKSEKGMLKTDTAEPLPAWRLDYDRKIIKRLAGFNPDLGILAGYMLVMGLEMCQRYDMINLHPAAPRGPKGTWQDVIWQLIEQHAAETGVMMHLVTPQLDRGPVVSYCTFPIQGQAFQSYWDQIKGKTLEEVKSREGEENALFKLIRRCGFARELPLVVSTIRGFSQGKVRISVQKQVVDAGGRAIKGYDLTDEIDRELRRTSPELV